MKTIPPRCPEPETGAKYWRSLDELADTPQFRQWVEREFPEGASEWTDPVTRRDFTKIMSASFLLAGFGLTGCRRPESIIYPFTKLPEGYVHGSSTYYATAMPTRNTAIPLLAKSSDGRPTKLEGNRDHPDSNGGTNTFAQASILNLYDPDRATQFLRGGNSVPRDEALSFLAQLSRDAQGNGGQGLCFLMEQSSSPTRRRLQGLIRQKLPQARWFSHEPIDLQASQAAASQLYGTPVSPYYKLDAAKVIVSLDCDFIGGEEDTYIHCRRFARGRKIEKPTDSMNRLYAVEALLTLTGGNADHRLRVPPSVVMGMAARLAMEVLSQGGQANASEGLRPLAEAAKDHEKWILACAQDLLANRNQAIVMAGYRQPLLVQALAHAMNAALGAVGNTVVFRDVTGEAAAGAVEPLARLVEALNAGQVQNLVVLGPNPAYNAPADLNWSAAQAKAKTVIRLGYYEDESSVGCTWHLPMAHFLESWGDARTSDGTVVPVQPLIEPLFGGLTEIEVLARLGGLDQANPYDIVRTTFKALAGDDEEKWKKYLHDGFLPGSAYPALNAQLNTGALGEFLKANSTPPPPAPTPDRLQIVFCRDYSIDDGRFSNNGWMQEMPDPITKMSWDNAVLVSRATASARGLQNGDVVEITVGDRKMRGGIWVQPGLADNTLGLALGYGRDKAGRVGNKVGFNAYVLRTTQALHMASGATLTKTGGTYPFACTQDHWSMEGRAIIREANLQQYAKTPDFAKRIRPEEPPVVQSLYPNPLKEAEEKALHQWGMSIDLNACVACGACAVACQSENNVPIVGKKMVAMGREMHWLRMDRYFTGDPAREKTKKPLASDSHQQFEEWIDDPQVVNQPMLCQHCEAAPCENVCPVNATVHDQEGLNLMVYNRCVGTRYCSNNCPYKVRRFNYFDYNKRPLDRLLLGPLASRPQAEYDLIKLSKNPEVTVRMRGVMEKCTMCVQRIEVAKIAQKVKARDSGDVHVPDGTFTTACAQACPAEAIVFGNIADPNSRVAQLKKLDRDYTVLDFLYTRPRLTYLAKVRNPNPKMPDYYEMPLSLQEYSQHMGSNPLEENAKERGAARPEGAEKGAR